MARFRCTIHNIDFEYPEVTKDQYYCECPWCLQDELKKAKVELKASQEHRAALLRAIEIKRTIEPLVTP